MDRQRPKSNGSSCSKGKCTGKPGSPCCVKGCCGEKQNSRHDHEKANECSNWRPSNQTSSKVAKGPEGLPIPAVTLTEIPPPLPDVIYCSPDKWRGPIFRTFPFLQSRNLFQET